MKALLLVDVQNDFCPGGALPAPFGDEVVPVINSLLDSFDLVVASKDWHPPQTVHFEKWPPHCVRDTHGAEFHPGLKAEKIDKIFLKGTDDKDDGYSAFEATNADLTDYLRGKGIKQLFVTCLTTEYCVKESVMEALRQGFETFMIEDAVKGIGVHPDDIPNAISDMQKAGAKMISSYDLLKPN